MRLNSHKNVGEIYEVLENFKLSKTHYTQALKIKKDDSWVWNKIGGIEYEKFGNL
jgi:Tfp pilus assembly protein PilF